MTANATRIPVALAQRLRDALSATKLSNYAISQETGVDQATIGRFRSGERTITLETADKLCEGLKLSVTIGSRK